MTAMQILWLLAAIVVAFVLLMRWAWPPDAMQAVLFALFVHCLSGTGQVR